MEAQQHRTSAGSGNMAVSLISCSDGKWPSSTAARNASANLTGCAGSRKVWSAAAADPLLATLALCAAARSKTAWLRNKLATASRRHVPARLGWFVCACHCGSLAAI